MQTGRCKSPAQWGQRRRTLTFSNQSGMDFYSYIDAFRISVYDNLGGEYPTVKDVQHIAIKSATKDASTRYNTAIPNDITTSVTIIISDFDKDATFIKLCKFELQTGPSGSRSYYPVEIRNVPITKP